MKSALLGEEFSKGTEILDEGNVGKLHGIVHKRTEKVRTDAHQIVEEKFKDRMPKWVSEAEKVAKNIRNQAKEIDGESERIKTLLHDWTEAWNVDSVKSMQAELASADARMKKLRPLADIHEALESLDSTERRNKHDYLKRASLILALDGSMQSLLNLASMEQKQDGPSSSDDDLPVQESAIKSLRDELIVRKENLTYDLYEEWAKIFQWDVNQAETNRLAINIGTRFEDLIASLRMIDLLDKKMEHLGKCLFNYLLLPLLRDHGSNLKIDASDNVNQAEIVLTKPKGGQEKAQFSAKVLDDCLKIFELLKDKTKSEPTFAQQLTDRFVLRPLKELIVEKILKPAVPADSAETPKFDRLMASCDRFLHQLKVEKLISEEESSFDQFSANVDTLFLAKRCQHILEQANRLISADLHATAQVGGEAKSENAAALAKCLETMREKKGKAEEEKESSPLQVDFEKPLPPLSEFPRCKVSQSVVSLLELLVKTLNESANSSNPLTAARLYHCARSMIEMYLDLVSVRHEHQLRQVPQATAIFYNNCYFLCHHLLTLGAMYESKLVAAFGVASNVVTVTFIDLIPKLKELAHDFMDAQVVAQTRYLIDCLNPAAGFNSVSEKTRTGVCQKAIKACVMQFQHIHRVWNQVLPPVLSMKFQGKMGEELLKHIVKAVVALEDIAAEDASIMHQMFTGLLADVESQFVIDKVSYAHRYCENSYYQFKELLFILNASLSEIEDRWLYGPLADCMDPLDVKQLIRALFQNTDKRAAVIAKIK